MRECDAQFLRSGKTVKDDKTGEKYYLIWTGQEWGAKEGHIDGVNLNNKRRYDLLTAWLSNGVAKKEGGEYVKECEKERKGYVVSLAVKDISPANVVRFITPHYETMFEVPDLGRVKVNGEIRRVCYLDEYHFQFIGKDVYMGCWHICQFAERVKMNCMLIEKVD